MKTIFFLLVLISLLCSCGKKTECSGTLYLLNGATSVPDREITFREIRAGVTLSKKVFYSDQVGNYNFTFKSKRDRSYVLSTEFTRTGSVVILKGEINKIDFFLAQ
ncbi:MAG: hypothetical protein IPM51_03150 [Sphingobacteriaceae bacterium]|nr:hypothetical protein [Sphingobacteriaceae bacterium]